MCDATSNVRPGRRALSAHQVVDVVERNDASATIPPRISSDANVENTPTTITQNGRLPLMKPQPKRPSLLPDESNAGLDRGKGPSDEAEVTPEHSFGRGVRNRDDPIIVNPQNDGGHSRQDRLDERAPFIIERVRVDEAGLLTQQLGRHLVERVSKVAEVSIGTARRHLNMEIAGSNFIGRVNETADGWEKPIGEGQSKPDRREQHGERQHHEYGRKAQLEAVPMSLKTSPHIGN